MREGMISMNTERDLLRENLRDLFELDLEERLDRHLESKPHGISPSHHFSYPSHECVESYRDARFFSAVSLSQSLVDGITRFACVRNRLKSGKDVGERIHRLLNSRFITASCGEAMQRIWDSQRNDFHHMNPSVTTDLSTLKRMAKGNLDDLAIIESELFAFHSTDGAVAVVHPQYWDPKADGKLPVYLRLE